MWELQIKLELYKSLSNPIYQDKNNEVNHAVQIFSNKAGKCLGGVKAVIK